MAAEAKRVMAGGDRVRTGGCLCGQLRFEARGEPDFVSHCHCRSCRLATGAAFATYAGFSREQVSITGEVRTFNSSPGVTRSFCPRCGSPLAYEAQGPWAGQLHLFAANFDAPDSLAPATHVYTRDQLSWIRLDDGLPRRREFSTEAPQ